MVNFIIALGAFFLEWFLLWAFFGLLYFLFSQFILTRYLIAYPGLILIANVMGWALCFCIYLFYAIGSEFYYAFINYVPYHEDTSRTGKYIVFLNNSTKISTVIMTAISLFFIYAQEKEYWQSKKSNRTNP